jgi:hypothetical protein
MKTCLQRVCGLVLLLLLVHVMPASAQATGAHPILTLPAAGTFQGGGEFTGTISINRFEQRGARVVAVGFVSGVLTRANRTLGTAVAGEIVWPVAVRSGGIAVARGPRSERATPTLVVLRPEPASARFMGAQATTCQVLDVVLGPINVDLLGAQVALGAVSLSIDGQSGTPLGDLICAASDLVGRVADVVNLLNSLLGLVIGLLGGLAGGLGGAVPMP